MNWEIEEIKRMLFSKKMIIGLLLGFIAMLYGSQYILNNHNINFIDTFIFAQTDNTTAIMGLLVPILAVLPASTSYRDELSCGYYYFLKSKMKIKRYLHVKLFCTALSGAIVIGVPNLLFFIISIIVKGIYVDGESDVGISFFADIYESAPISYGCLLIINAAVCGAIFAILGIGISAWVKNKYLAMIIPFSYYIFSGMVLININPWLNAISIFCVNQYWDFNIFAIVFYDFILFFVGVVLFVTGVNYENRYT